jgi:hypothetical protein
MSNFNIDAIIQSANLRQLVEQAGGELGNHGRCACPLHGGNDTNAFSVYHKDGRDLWKCFSGDCGGGDVIEFVQKWQGVNFRDACAFLGGDIASDPVAIQASSKARHDAAILETIAAQERQEARRKELQKSDLHLFYNQTMKQWGSDMWLARGIDESFQGLWYLGSCDDKAIMYKGVEYHTPTLTIPIMAQDYSVLNIKHRLINPPKVNDKYRPEREGLGAFPPFLAYPELGYCGSVVWVIEGEIKAMVTATITPDSDWQFIGVPGKSQFGKLTGQLTGKNVIVVPDPGGETEAVQFCRAVNGRYIKLPDKIDDLIVAHGYDADWLRSIERQTRRIR